MDKPFVKQKYYKNSNTSHKHKFDVAKNYRKIKQLNSKSKHISKNHNSNYVDGNIKRCFDTGYPCPYSSFWMFI